VSAIVPRRFDDVGECVDAALRRLGNRLVIAAPLAIGKPNGLLNEFYRRAARDPKLHLTLFTALSLNRPTAHSELEARFLEPFVARVFGDYPDLDYVTAARAGRLPPNVEVREFYLQAGAWLGVESVQQHYMSVNYTHVVRDLVTLGVNVLAQEIATRSVAAGDEYSLSSNPDLTLDVLQHFDAARAAGHDVLMIGAVNRRMPFMLGEAVVPESRFDFLLDHARYEHDLYCPPNLPLSDVEHAIGLNAAALVRDGGTLQLGIGELGDAIVYALQLRQQHNETFRQALAAVVSPNVAPARLDSLAASSRSSGASMPAPRCSSTAFSSFTAAGSCRGASTRTSGCSGCSMRARSPSASTWNCWWRSRARGANSSTPRNSRRSSAAACSCPAPVSRRRTGWSPRTAHASRRASTIPRPAWRWPPVASRVASTAAACCTPDSSSDRAASTGRCASCRRTTARAFR
jgi:hypothetical protein